MPYTTGYTVGTSTASGTIDPVWQGWNTVSTTDSTSFSIQSDVWRSWNTTIASTAGHLRQAGQQFEQTMRLVSGTYRERTDEEIRAEREALAQRNREERARVERQREMADAIYEKRQEAELRGWALIRAVVPAEDIIDGALPYLKVRGGVSGDVYRIYTNTGIHGNVYLFDEHGCQLASYCGAPSVHVGTAAERSEARRSGELTTIPNSDAWLGQYLALKYNETGYLSHANRSVVGRCHQAAIAA
jgi:hypothetical protein